jgi:plastocyanin
MKIKLRLAAPVFVLASFLQIAPGAPSLSLRGRVEMVQDGLKMRKVSGDAGGVVVWMIPKQGVTTSAAGRGAKVRITQKDKRFVPHIQVVEVGTEVDFPNSDPFFHNVFSVYNGKIFDLGLYANGESRPVRFDRPGVSYIFCNIHPQMSAVILAVATPYFSVSSADGSFAIQGLPEHGVFELNFWHERSEEKDLGKLRQTIGLESGDVDLGLIRIRESPFVPKAHSNKFGDDYPPDHGSGAYGKH